MKIPYLVVGWSILLLSALLLFGVSAAVDNHRLRATNKLLDEQHDHLRRHRDEAWNDARDWQKKYLSLVAPWKKI